MNDQEFEAGLKEFTDPAGVHHEAFKSNFAYKPELRQRFDDLFKSRWPEPESTPPPSTPAPQPEPATPKAPGAENWPAPPAAEPLSAAEQSELDAEKTRGLDELRNRWSGRYDTNLRDMAEMRDQLWNSRDPGDMAVREVINGVVGNDPRFAVRLQELKAELGERLKSSPPVDTSGMTRQQQESKVIAFAQLVLKDLKSPMSQAILEAVGDDRDGRVFNWALKNAVRVFGR
jgi:hypothetical protein